MAYKHVMNLKNRGAYVTRMVFSAVLLRDSIREVPRTAGLTGKKSEISGNRGLNGRAYILMLNLLDSLDNIFYQHHSSRKYIILFHQSNFRIGKLR